VHKILIVPDDILGLELEPSFLDRRAVRTRVAVSGAEALSITAVWHPDVVIFGSVLDDMPAAVFIERVRASVPAPGPQLIRITSSVDEHVVDLDQRLYDAHLIAPLEARQLLDTAAALLELQQRRWQRVRATINVHLAGMVEDASHGPDTPAVTIDIGEGGMRVEPRDPLSVGQSGTATLVLPGSQIQLVLGCTVRALVDEMDFHYGLEFMSPTQDQLDLLRAFIQRQTGKQGRSG
jgi:DNA-binding response OmpR family regulator